MKTIDGIKTHIRAGGDPDATEAVLLLHGNPGPSDDWLVVFDEIAKFARVIAPDMPSYGRSERPKRFDWTTTGYANFLGAILDELRVDRVHLVLHDFGGPWGLTWAAANPKRVASISLINVGLMPGYRWHGFARIWRTPILGELFQLITTRRVLKYVLNSSNPKPLPDEFFDRVSSFADWPHKKAVLRLYRSASNPGDMAMPLIKALKPYQIPAMVIWGEADEFIPVRYAEMQADFFKATVHRLAESGHWPMIDQPDRFRQILVPFLRSQVGY